MISNMVVSRRPKINASFIRRMISLLREANINVENLLQLIADSPQGRLLENIKKCVNEERRRSRLPLDEILSFPCLVPREYSHGESLTRFSWDFEPEFFFFSEDLTDGNFSGTSDELIAGHKFQVVISRVNKQMSVEDCRGLISEKGGIPVGPQGLALIYPLHRDFLIWLGSKEPISIFSLCKEDAVWGRLDLNGCMSSIFVMRSGDFSFTNNRRQTGLEKGDYILYFVPDKV